MTTNKHKQLLEIDLIYRINCPMYKNMNLMLSYAILSSRNVIRHNGWIEAKWMSDVLFLFWSHLFGMPAKSSYKLLTLQAYLPWIIFVPVVLCVFRSFSPFPPLNLSLSLSHASDEWTRRSIMPNDELSIAFYILRRVDLGDFVNLSPKSSPIHPV